MPVYDIRHEDHQALLDVIRALGLVPEDIAAGSMHVDLNEHTITVDELIRNDDGSMRIAGDEAVTIRRTYQIDHHARLITEEKP